MTFRFLIDECLTPELVQLAVKAGHSESTCVRDRGLAGTKDWKLIAFVVEGDFTLVTNNSVDFRAAARASLGASIRDRRFMRGLCA